MMKNFYYFLFFLTLSSSIWAQEKFVKGYYINVQKDTIRGEILDMDWEVNPRDIQFRNTENSIQTLKSNQIIGFGLLDKSEHYISKNLTITTIREVVSSGSSPINKKIETDYFLQIIVNTPLIKLYSLYPSEDNRLRFFIDKNEMFEELINYEYIITNKQGEFRNRVTTYKEQLESFFADCSEYKLGMVSYNEDVLKSKIIDYCEAKTGIKYISKTKSAISSFGIIADVSPDKPSSYYIGLTYRTILPRNFNKNFVDVEVRLISVYKKNFSLPTFEFLAGKFIGNKDLKPTIGVGLGGSTNANIWVIPALGFVYKSKMAFEFRKNFAVFNFGETTAKPFFIRYKYFFGKSDK